MAIKFTELEINLQWKWFLRPRQRDGVTVDDYYAQFCDWKEEMISVSFPATEEDYIEGFIENLKWDIRWRSSKYESSRIGLTNAFRNAKFEESMMQLEAYSHTHVVLNQAAQCDLIAVEEICTHDAGSVANEKESELPTMNPLAKEEDTLAIHSVLGSQTTDEHLSDEEVVVNESPESIEMLDFDEIKSNDSPNSNEMPKLAESVVSESGLKVLSIYCAYMSSKWNNILELRPKQRKDMSVEAYYDLFYSWKRKLDAINYIGGEESYIDDFIYGLEIKLGMRVLGYKWKPLTLYGAFRRAEIEEIMMKNDADMVLEEMPRLNSIDIQSVENVSYVRTNVELDTSLGSEFTIKASLLEKDNEPIQLLLQKPVGHNEGNVIDGGVELQAALGSLGGTTMNASSNGSAKYWLEGAALFIEVVFGHNALKKDASTMINEMPADEINEHLIAPNIDGLLMFTFDPGINSLFDEMFQSFQVAKLEEQVIHPYAPHDVKLIMLAISDPGGSRTGVVCSSRRDTFPLIGKSHVMYVFGFKGARHANAFSNTWEILCLSGSSFVGNEWGLKDLKAHIQMVLLYRFLGKCYHVYPLNDILMFVFDPGGCFLRCMDCDILEHNGEQGDFHFTTIIVDAPECCYYAFDEDPAKGISIFLVMGIEFEKWHSHLVVENCCRLFDPGGCLFYNGCVYSEFNVYQGNCLDTIMVVLRKSNPQILDPRTSTSKDQLTKNKDQRNVYGSLLFLSVAFPITLLMSWYKESITVRHVIFIERKCGLYALDGRMQACATEFGLCAIWIHILEGKDVFERIGKWIIRMDHIRELIVTMPMFVSPREDHLGVIISQSAGNVAFLIALSSQLGISTKDSETIMEKGVLPSTSLQTLSRREFLIFFENVIMSIINDSVSLHYLFSVSATADLIFMRRDLEPCEWIQYQNQVIDALKIRSINHVTEMKGRMLYDRRVFGESKHVPFCCHLVSFLNPCCVLCCFSLMLWLVGDLAYTNAMLWLVGDLACYGIPAFLFRPP